MTRKKAENGLSRRTLLGGLGAIGVASAGAGLGTTAYFSDEEGFTENSLEAGELDLKMDYRITYDGGPGRLEELQAIYDEDPNYNENVSVTEYPEGSGTYVLDQVPERSDYPEPDGWIAAANVGVESNGELGGFEREELTDAGFPLFKLEDVKPGDYGEATISFHLFDNPAYMWMGGSLNRNAQNGINDPERAALEEAGYTQTESDDPEFFADSAADDELYYNAEGDWGGQLADAIRARVWYDDNCNNVYEEGEESGPVDIAVVVDVSGSMTYEIGNPGPDNVVGDGQGPNSRIYQAVSAIESLSDNLRTNVNGSGDDDRLGIVQFGGIDEELLPLTDASSTSTIDSAIDQIEAYQYGDAPRAGTNIGAGLYGGRQVLEASSSGRREVMIVIGDGAPTWTYRDGSDFPSYSTWQSWDDADKEAAADDTTVSTAQNDVEGVADEIKDETDIMIYTIGFGLEGVSNTAPARQTLVNIASEDVSGTQPTLFFEAPEEIELVQIFAQIAQILFGETVIAEGTLREVLEALSEGYALDANRFVDGTACYPAGLTRCVGFEWWLPADVGNEVQTDLVEFDIDFYAEQCRHNDGETNPFVGETSEPV
jgi:predicted ribosomally synthesized peptide with SipW-like signal peptide